MKCGTGTETVKVIECDNEPGESYCVPEFREFQQSCDAGIACPVDNVYGEWTPWSDCSKTCHDGVAGSNVASYQVRSRTCTGGNCLVGTLGNMYMYFLHGLANLITKGKSFCVEEGYIQKYSI